MDKSIRLFDIVSIVVDAQGEISFEKQKELKEWCDHIESQLPDVGSINVEIAESGELVIDGSFPNKRGEFRFGGLW